MNNKVLDEEFDGMVREAWGLDPDTMPQNVKKGLRQAFFGGALVAFVRISNGEASEVGASLDKYHAEVNAENKAYERRLS